MGKNIIVGDIGSTKSTWRSNFGLKREILLSGYNPVVHEESTCQIMFENLSAALGQDRPEKIWYYGAGVIDDETAASVSKIARAVFLEAKILVKSDLTGACIAACGDSLGSVVILGTGSHCALYDGKKVVKQAVSLGYVLGDEGSGSDIGKHLLRAYFHGRMPEAIAADVEAMLPEGRVGFLKHLYQGGTPNQYLAEFARVAVTWQHEDWTASLVSERFTTFIQLHVLPLVQTGPIHVIGSIGFIFAGLFTKALENAGLTAGEFIRDPAQRLFDTHLNMEGNE